MPRNPRVDEADRGTLQEPFTPPEGTQLPPRAEPGLAIRDQHLQDTPTSQGRMGAPQPSGLCKVRQFIMAGGSISTGFISCPTQPTSREKLTPSTESPYTGNVWNHYPLTIQSHTGLSSVPSHSHGPCENWGLNFIIVQTGDKH